VVKKGGMEAKRWAEITPEMMSEEELDEDNKVYIRHPPEYRSSTLNKFIEKLDERVEAGFKGVHPRMQRLLGSPRKRSPPKYMKDWAINSPSVIDGEGLQSEIPVIDEDECSDSDSSDILSQYKPQ